MAENPLTDGTEHLTDGTDELQDGTAVEGPLTIALEVLAPTVTIEII